MCEAHSSMMFPVHSSAPCIHETPSLSVGLTTYQLDFYGLCYIGFVRGDLRADV